MKVLTVRSLLSDNGPGTQPLSIAREFATRGHETVFVTGGGEYVPKIEATGFKVYIVTELAPDKHRLSEAFKGIIKLRSIIISEKPDVIHGHNAAATLYASFAARLARQFIPCVTSVRGVEERSTHQWRNYIWRLLPGRLLGVCDKTRVRLEAFGCSPDKIDVTYNGVDLARFDPEKHNREEARKILGVEQRHVIGTVGAMTGPTWLSGPSKGQHNLLKAASALLGDYPDVAVVLVGDGPARKSLENLAAELSIKERVYFTGRRFDVERLIPAFDIFVLPSIFGEFFPNSIIEAMAMRRPWIGSDIAGLSELTAGGRAGQVLPPNDVTALAYHLGRLLADRDLQRVRGLRGRQEVEQRFTISRVADRILSAYDKAGA